MALTEEQIDRLLAFKGYGNPLGDYWFIGMEEGGKAPEEELVIRARQFRDIEDLKRANDYVDPTADRRKLKTDTWISMCHIVGRLNGEKGWRNSDFVRDYQESSLGRVSGDTFLTEILPLPKPSLSSWPYGYRWTTKSQYVDSVLDGRLNWIRAMHRECNPTVTICYGKTFWPHHKVIFEERAFTSALDGDIEISAAPDSIVVLTRFFDPSYQKFTVDFIDQMCGVIEETMNG